jgi:hypothetical protein
MNEQDMAEAPLYPVGLQDFEKIRCNNYLYVDKTELVYKLARNQNYFFLSRPRRFGKSLLTSTLQCYFEGRKELFTGLAMERLEKEWTRYPVLHFDLSDVKSNRIENIENNLSGQLNQYEKIYGKEEEAFTLSRRMGELIQRAKAATGQNVVVLIDEYDAPILAVLHDKKMREEVRGLLREFFSPLKKCDGALRFVFITGISMFSQLSIFSELNNLEIISMTGEYASICGITEQELRNNFAPGIRTLAEAKGCSQEEMVLKLQDEYDGYHFSKDSEGLFNPFSLLSAFKQNELGRYWFRSGTPGPLVEMLRRYQQRGKFDISTFERSVPIAAEKFESPLEAETGPLPLLYQAGYLTIKESVGNKFVLGIPNSEVRVGLLQNLLPLFSSFSSDESIDVRSAADDASDALLEGDVEAMMLQLKSVLASVPHMKGDKNILADAEKTEAHYHILFYFFFRMLSKEVYAEVHNALGDTDVVIKTPKYIYIVEIKIDATPEVALAQIEAKGYATPFLADGRKLVRIGVNFSTKSRTIEAWKAVTEPEGGDCY